LLKVVDYVKAILPEKYNQTLSNNSYLTFESTANEHTGEQTQRIAKYKNLKFEFKKSGVVYMTGSLHRFYNDGTHNYNDFTLENLCSSLRLIANNLSIELSEAVLQNIEFGVNIEPPIKVNALLRGLLFHTGKKMPMEEFKHVSLQSGNYKQVRRDRFFLKAYDKGKHYNLKTNLFRWEVKIIKMVEIEHLNINNLNDLINLSDNQLEGILTMLKQRWNEVLYFDSSINKALLKRRIKLKINNWQSLIYSLAPNKFGVIF